MSELVKINLIRKLEEIGIIDADIAIILLSMTSENTYNVYDSAGDLFFRLTEKAYEELDKF